MTRCDKLYAINIPYSYDIDGNKENVEHWNCTVNIIKMKCMRPKYIFYWITEIEG